MKLPSEAQLSREQKEVCYAPSEEVVLVVGPPGSGKTVVAIYRLNSLKNQNKKVTAVAYNKVLSQYAGMDKTYNAWLGSWWRNLARENFPTNGRPFDLNYLSAIERLKSDLKEPMLQKGNWNHLIMDEAQDFASDAHRMFGFILNAFGNIAGEPKPSILILADENQRLNQKTNATIKQIETAYLLGKEDVYQLKKNYRNTREIAELARFFYTGLKSGIPELPDSRGDKPKLHETSNLDDAIEKIVRHSQMNENEEIGVLVPYDYTRKKIFNKLTHRLKNSKIKVRTYTSKKNDPNNNTSNLIFNKKGVITVLNYASSKGLEFDTVFLPELQENKFDAGSDIDFKMNLYVMISRARQKLFMMISDGNHGSPVRRYLPTEPGLLDT